MNYVLYTNIEEYKRLICGEESEISTFVEGLTNKVPVSLISELWSKKVQLVRDKVTAKKNQDRYLLISRWASRELSECLRGVKIIVTKSGS